MPEQRNGPEAAATDLIVSLVLLGAGFLLATVHWTALVRWRALRRRAMPHVDYL